MKTTILSTLIVGGIILLILSCLPFVSISYRAWLVYLSVAVEGLAARYLVLDTTREMPGSSFITLVLPATGPLAVLIACLMRLFGFFGVPIL